MNTTDHHPSALEPLVEFGVALSGGGARGFAHAGALKAIEEAGIRPQIIAGVSAGSVVAALYAAGMSPDDILAIFESEKPSDFVNLNIFRGSVMRIDKFMDFLSQYLPKDFSELRMPTHIGVTNLSDGVHEEFHSGPLLPVVQASCSIPIAFAPVKINGKHYVDGGVLRNMPAWTIRHKCRILLGVNVSPMPTMHEENPSLMDVALRTYQLMAKSNQQVDMDMCDLAIDLHEISHHRVFDLNNIRLVFNSGYIHMRKALRDRGLWNL